MLHFLAIILIILYHLTGQVLGMDYLYVAQIAFFLIPGVVYIITHRHSGPPKAEDPSLSFPSLKLIFKILLQMLAVSFIAMSLVTLTDYFFPIPEWILNMMPQDASFSNVRDVAFYALMPAVCEEFFFRGFYLNALLKKQSASFAVATATIVFGVAHLNPWFLPGLLVLGFYISRLYAKEQNLWLCILCHFFNNFVALWLLGFQQ
ncbi:CPBP family intramembrane metalloprotease [bacterium]|nr:CPBP family intramembrane metalloprotease [bacterium]